MSVTITKKRSNDSYFDGTTHNEVVRKSASFQELVEKLYEFGLKESARLPRAAREEELGNAVGDFIARLMEATQEALEENPGKPELECAEDILRRLRQPRKGARVHRKSGVRRRIRELVLKELGSDPLLIDRLEAVASEPSEKVSQSEPVCIGDLPELMLTEIRSELERAWEKVLDRVLLKVKRHSGVLQRRQAIIEILAKHAGQHAPHGVVSDHFDTVVRTMPPKAIIELLRSQGTVQERGRKKVSDDQLRHDIRLVKRAVLEEIDSMKEKERALRARIAGKWAGNRMKKLIDEAQRQGPNE